MDALRARRGFGLAVLGMLVGLAMLVGLGVTPGTVGAAEPSQPPDAVTLSIGLIGVEPAAARATPGGTVVWINDADSVRSVVATDASFMSGPLEPGEQFQFAFTEARTVSYEVPEIPGFTGTVVVADAAGGSPTDPSVPVLEVPNQPAAPASEFAFTGAATSVHALIGGMILAFGASLLILGHRFGLTAALTGWPSSNRSDDLLPSRRHRRVRKEQARRALLPRDPRRR